MNFLTFVRDVQSTDCEVLPDSPMSRQTTFKAGGNAKAILFPKTTDALLNILRRAAEQNVPYLVIGNGSNLLVRDSGIDAAVIKMTEFETDIQIDGTTVRCGAGTPLSKLCYAAYENSLTGLEFAYGIPGTVGGAVFMNAGAYGGEMKDVLKNVTHISPDLSKEVYEAEQLDFGYRKSFYSANPEYIITSAEFELTKDSKDEIKAKMDDLIGRRKDKQPLEYPSAGSTFKRPEGYFAGALIEECGLKGYTVGGAQVSEKHAGFVINKDNATASDILTLMEDVTRIVREQKGVTLEPEVRIIP